MRVSGVGGVRGAGEIEEEARVEVEDDRFQRILEDAQASAHPELAMPSGGDVVAHALRAAAEERGGSAGDAGLLAAEAPRPTSEVPNSSPDLSALAQESGEPRSRAISAVDEAKHDATNNMIHNVT